MHCCCFSWLDNPSSYGASTDFATEDKNVQQKPALSRQNWLPDAGVKKVPKKWQGTKAKF